MEDGAGEDGGKALACNGARATWRRHAKAEKVRGAKGSSRWEQEEVFQRQRTTPKGAVRGEVRCSRHGKKRMRKQRAEDGRA